MSARPKAVVVGTDGSVVKPPMSRRQGWAWRSSTGDCQAGMLPVVASQTHDQAVVFTELAAIEQALLAHTDFTHVAVFTDSLNARELIEAALAGRGWVFFRGDFAPDEVIAQAVARIVEVVRGRAARGWTTQIWRGHDHGISTDSQCIRQAHDEARRVRGAAVAA